MSQRGMNVSNTNPSGRWLLAQLWIYLAGGAMFIVFIQYFIIRQLAMAHHSLGSLSPVTNFKANAVTAQSIYYLPVWLSALCECRNFAWYLNIWSLFIFSIHCKIMMIYFLDYVFFVKISLIFSFYFQHCPMWLAFWKQALVIIN